MSYLQFDADSDSMKSICFNHDYYDYAAKIVYIYIPFQASISKNKIPLNYVTYRVVDAQLIKLFNTEMSMFHK